MAGSLTKSPTVVLIVEDEPLLRMLTVEVVGEAGFVAPQAGNADKAVALLEACPDISVTPAERNVGGCLFYAPS